jgi:hypothetical protein
MYSDMVGFFLIERYNASKQNKVITACKRKKEKIFFFVYLTWTGCAVATLTESSKTGLSMEYEDGGGDLDRLMLVSLRIKPTVPFSLRSLHCQT